VTSDFGHHVVHSEGIAAIVATHDPAPLAIADHVIELSDGKVTERHS
jgi:putative ABC transport system ATP-binding protein